MASKRSERCLLLSRLIHRATTSSTSRPRRGKGAGANRASRTGFAERDALSTQGLRYQDTEQLLGLERGHGFLGESGAAVDRGRVLGRDLRHALGAHLEITGRGTDAFAGRFGQQLSFH